MPKRFIKQVNRSYSSKYLEDLQNIIQHVINARRPDADILFNEVAHEAAMNGLTKLHCGEQGVCFLQPTDNPRGYFSLLKFLEKKGPTFRQDIIKSKFAPDTIYRCISAKFIYPLKGTNPKTKRESTLFRLTSLGEAYIKAAASYVVKRGSPRFKNFS